RGPGLVGERAGEHQEVTGRGARGSEVYVLLSWWALHHDQRLARTRACRGGRGADADRRNDRGSEGHRATRRDELSSHLPAFLVLELRSGKAMGHRLAESWGNVGWARVRRIRQTWALMLLGRALGGFPRRRITSTGGFPDTGPG